MNKKAIAQWMWILIVVVGALIGYKAGIFTAIIPPGFEGPGDTIVNLLYYPSEQGTSFACTQKEIIWRSQDDPIGPNPNPGNYIVTNDGQPFTVDDAYGYGGLEHVLDNTPGCINCDILKQNLGITPSNFIPFEGVGSGVEEGYYSVGNLIYLYKNNFIYNCHYIIFRTNVRNLGEFNYDDFDDGTSTVTTDGHNAWIYYDGQKYGRSSTQIYGTGCPTSQRLLTIGTDLYLMDYTGGDIGVCHEINPSTSEARVYELDYGDSNYAEDSIDPTEPYTSENCGFTPCQEFLSDDTTSCTGYTYIIYDENLGSGYNSDLTPCTNNCHEIYYDWTHTTTAKTPNGEAWNAYEEDEAYVCDIRIYWQQCIEHYSNHIVNPEDNVPSSGLSCELGCEISIDYNIPGEGVIPVAKCIGDYRPDKFLCLGENAPIPLFRTDSLGGHIEPDDACGFLCQDYPPDYDDIVCWDCEPGSPHICDGTRVMECTHQATGYKQYIYEEVEDCANYGKLCENGACVDECTDGQTSCDGNDLYECFGGVWQFQETCDGGCGGTPPDCLEIEQPGIHCFGGLLTRCLEDCKHNVNVLETLGCENICHATDEMKCELRSEWEYSTYFCDAGGDYLINLEDNPFPYNGDPYAPGWACNNDMDEDCKVALGSGGYSIYETIQCENMYDAPVDNECDTAEDECNNPYPCENCLFCYYFDTISRVKYYGTPDYLAKGGYGLDLNYGANGFHTCIIGCDDGSCIQLPECVGYEGKLICDPQSPNDRVQCDSTGESSSYYDTCEYGCIPGDYGEDSTCDFPQYECFGTDPHYECDGGFVKYCVDGFYDNSYTPYYCPDGCSGGECIAHCVEGTPACGWEYNVGHPETTTVSYICVKGEQYRWSPDKWLYEWIVNNDCGEFDCDEGMHDCPITVCDGGYWGQEKQCVALDLYLCVDNVATTLEYHCPTYLGNSEAYCNNDQCKLCELNFMTCENDNLVVCENIEQGYSLFEDCEWRCLEGPLECDNIALRDIQGVSKQNFYDTEPLKITKKFVGSYSGDGLGSVSFDAELYTDADVKLDDRYDKVTNSDGSFTVDFDKRQIGSYKVKLMIMGKVFWVEPILVSNNFVVNIYGEQVLFLNKLDIDRIKVSVCKKGTSVATGDCIPPSDLTIFTTPENLTVNVEPATVPVGIWNLILMTDLPGIYNVGLTPFWEGTQLEEQFVTLEIRIPTITITTVVPQSISLGTKSYGITTTFEAEYLDSTLTATLTTPSGEVVPLVLEILATGKVLWEYNFNEEGTYVLNIEASASGYDTAYFSQQIEVSKSGEATPPDMREEIFEGLDITTVLILLVVAWFLFFRKKR